MSTFRKVHAHYKMIFIFHKTAAV